MHDEFWRWLWFLLSPIRGLWIFLREQVRLFSPEYAQTKLQHFSLTFVQRLIVTSTCLLYLVPAHFYWYSGFPVSAILMTVVALCSSLSDGNWFPRLSPYFYILDQMLAFLGFVHSIAARATSMSREGVFWGILTFSMLHQSRKQTAVWKWILYHGLWHFIGMIGIMHMNHGWQVGI